MRYEAISHCVFADLRFLLLKLLRGDRQAPSPDGFTQRLHNCLELLGFLFSP